MSPTQVPERIEFIYRDSRVSETMMFESMGKTDKPTFSAGEAAKVFFARSSHWIRYCQTEGFFVLDGKPVGDTRDSNGARIYTLRDIEQMSHALATNGKIDAVRLRHILALLYRVGQVWGHIPDDEIAESDDDEGQDEQQ